MVVALCKGGLTLLHDSVILAKTQTTYLSHRSDVFALTQTNGEHIWTLEVLPMSLTHWDRETHICVGKLTIIGSDNGLSPGRRQAIIWTNAGTLLIGPLGTNFNETLIEIHTFSFKKIHLKISSGKWRPFCLGLNVLPHWGRVAHICVHNLTIIGSDNGLSPGRRQAIIWINVGILLIRP